VRTSLRTVLATSMVAAVALAGGATAAPAKAVCNLMTDPKGDASFLDTLPNDPSLDIVSADVATDAKTLTGVLRVDKYSAVSPTSPLGRGYYVMFNAPKSEFPIYLNVQVTPDLTRFAWGTRETLASGNGSYVRQGDATGVIDAATSELRISVPLSAVAAITKLSPGTKLTALTASTTSVLGTSVSGGLVATIDDAAGSKAYIAGTPSCVTPGK
jgi:hypothetical protein